jgi:hypothetical protein
MSEIVNPLTGNRLPTIDVTHTPVLIPAETLALVHTAVGAFTVRLPNPAADTNFVMVLDVDGSAAANPITVDGNGNLVDGAASAILSTNSVLASFVFDGGAWRRTLPLRRFLPEFPFVWNVDVDAAIPPPPGSSILLRNVGTPIAGNPFTAIDLKTTLFATNQGAGVGGLSNGKPGALTQLDWFVNAAGGSDTNDGATALTALATYREILRRWGTGTQLGPGTITIHLLDVIDPVSLPLARNYVGPDTILILQGVATTVRAGTFTAVTAANRATNTPWSGADAAMPGTWAADLGRRVRITAGPNAGNIFWVAKDLGAKTARFSWPSRPMVLDGNDDHLVPGVITNGDAYVVETFNAVTLDTIAPCANGYGSEAVSIPTVYLREMDAQSNDFISMHPQMAFVLVGVHFTGFPLVEGNEAVFSNCCFESGIQSTSVGAEKSVVDAGLVRVTSQPVSTLGLDADVMFQACGCELAASAIGRACMFDAPGAALDVDAEGGPTSVQHFRYAGAGALWGSGNAGAGMQVSSDTDVRYDDATRLTLTGAGGDFTLATSVTSRAFDPVTGFYTGPIANAWATLPLAVAGGGFGDDAHNPAKAARLVKIA